MSLPFAIRSRSADVVVVGAGPAGIAAAVTASENGASVLVLDDNFRPGGQIWRGEPADAKDRLAKTWLERFAALKILVLSSAQVLSASLASRTLIAETECEALEVQFEKLVLATGARELFLPFPGWTLPGVMGVGGLQAMVKSGMPIAGKRIVVAGSGPLLLAVAAHLRRAGAQVLLVAEQARMTSLARFAAGLISSPRKLTQAASLRWALRGVRYRTSCWVEEAFGDNAIKAVRIRQGRRVWTVECDYAAVAYGLYPNAELGALLGCRLENGAIAVDAHAQSSVQFVYAAGECTGIAGVDSALIEGQIAGLTATGRHENASALRPKQTAARRFAQNLERGFRLRDELRSLGQPETLLCRCEDVSLDRVRQFPSLRAAKLHTRCGMGPCQARICGAAAHFLFGWNAELPRTPLFPCRVGTLAYERNAMARSDPGHHHSL